MPANALAKAPGTPRNLIVLVRIKRVDADADAHDADLDQRFCHAIVDQHAIGAEHDDEAEPHGMSGDVQDVGTHQRFSAGDHQQASLVHLGNLIDETEAFLRTELIRPAAGFGRSIEITVITLEVAALGEVQRDEIGFEVINRATVVRRSRRRGRGDELRDLLLERLQLVSEEREIEYRQ
jgi:hypothetical protein